MKTIAILGTGVGPRSLTAEAAEAIARADVLLGAKRMLAPYKDRPSHPVYLPEDVADYIEKSGYARFAVLVSGDVGFYSAATGIAEALAGAFAEATAAYEARFVPGVSTVNAFFAKLKMPWQEAAFASLHGRDCYLMDTVRRNRLTFCLTGGKMDAPTCDKIYVGENLGQENERVYEASSLGDLPPLSVLLFVNEGYDDATPTGLADDAFHRLEGIPMTKAETRAIAISKLRLRPNAVCWDIGAGTGSVTAEMALSAYRGHVYAVERDPAAIPLIEKNCAALRIGNVTAICGEAPAALESLPAPDAAFIGGSGGEIGGIIAAILCKNPNARVAVAAITLETVSAALAAFKSAALEPEIVQINIAKAKPAGESHLMQAQNPVTLLCAGGKA
jgi:precorrin-6Y C5,15-methyltransferase (decarboxylating)